MLQELVFPAVPARRPAAATEIGRDVVRQVQPHAERLLKLADGHDENKHDQRPEFLAIQRQPEQTPPGQREAETLEHSHNACRGRESRRCQQRPGPDQGGDLERRRLVLRCVAPGASRHGATPARTTAPDHQPDRERDAETDGERDRGQVEPGPGPIRSQAQPVQVLLVGQPLHQYDEGRGHGDPERAFEGVAEEDHLRSSHDVQPLLLRKASRAVAGEDQQHPDRG